MKPSGTPLHKMQSTSPPARGRGLKPDASAMGILLAVVAPRTGAWIET